MSEMIRVVISSPDDKKDLFERVPRSATVRQLKMKWQEKFSVAAEDLFLETEDHKDLGDNTCLEDLTNKTAKFLSLIMQEAVKVEFSLMCSDKPSIQLSVFPSSQPSTLIPKIKRHFAIKDSREIRFSWQNSPLDSEVSFKDQEVIYDGKIEVELGLRVHLNSEWTCDENMEPIHCFTGDPVEPMLTSTFSEGVQLFHKGNVVNFSDRIGNALGITSPESEIDQTIEICIPRKIFLMDANSLREMSVWPNTMIRDLGLNSSNMLVCDAKVVSSAKTFVSVRDNMLLQADLCVSIVLSHEEPRKQRRCLVKLADRATVYDLWSKVSEIEKSRQISLFFRGCRLSDFFVELRDLGIKSGSSVTSKKDPPLSIAMRTSSGQDLTFTAPEVRSVTYSDLMRFHTANDSRKDRSLAFLQGLSFKCKGCGRRICREMDGRQLVPATCCDVSSMELITIHQSADVGVESNMEDKRPRTISTDIQWEFQAPLRDAATQAKIPNYDKFCQVELRTRDAATQARLPGHDKFCQVELRTRDQGVMARSLSSVRFQLFESNRNIITCCQINCFPTDSLTDLLERLSRETKISTDDMSFISQNELGLMKGRGVRYFAEAAKQETDENGKAKVVRVYANHDSSEECDSSRTKMLLATNIHVTELDDVHFLPGLDPIISIDIQHHFCELDDSEDFVVISRTAKVLLDPQYVAWMECFRLVDERGEMPPVMLLLLWNSLNRNYEYTDVRYGETFKNIGAASSAARIASENLRTEFCYILLRHKSRLPKWPISPNSNANIAIRDGSDFSIKNGMIEVNETRLHTFPRRWVCPMWNTQSIIPNDSRLHALVKQIMNYIST